MKTSLASAFIAAVSLMPFSLLFDSKAQASEWGCQVILCLSNPGGPVQYAECRQPIRKLWHHLAKGRPFPTCSDVGFRSSRPGYAPYYCNDDYTLIGTSRPRGHDATCLSETARPVDSQFCESGSESNWNERHSVASPRWQREGGGFQCMAYVFVRPSIRQQPHYIDVTIEGVGAQRVWY
ncbi:hypothetical protein [Aquamicrobium terrae]|uniref:hypothetical protein n=1 Tax=Aquamicrobium terrae TaxID=1324945 RepID=UPI0033910D25